MRNKIIGAFLCLALGAGFALAQSQSVQQSGTVTSGHVAGWVYNGIVQDGGSTTNPNLTAIGAYGTGDVNCVSNTKVRTGGWYNLCLGYGPDSSYAYLTLNAFGGAPSIPLNITADGSTFPLGPGSLSTLLDQQMGSTQGDILYRNATTWVVLPPAVSGFLATNGTGANPSWAAGTSLTAITANSALANTTASTTTPSATALPSCSTTGSFIQYTTNTGFSCGLQVGLTLPTEQVLTSGTTYTTPAGVRQIRIRMVGGGGGGSGSSGSALVNGTQGGTTTFNSINAIGGAGATATLGGYATTHGTGSAGLRVIGNAGGFSVNDSVAASGIPSGSGTGGAGFFGGGTPAVGGITVGISATANTGAGGSGASNNSLTNSTGGGGQAGEYVEIIINNPSASYTYAIGAGGAGGSSTTNGGAGGSGIIIVDEYY